MSKVKKKYVKWTDEMLQAEALKYETRGEFQKGSPSAYVIARRNYILDKICGHMEPVVYTNWTPELAISISKKFDTISELVRNRPDCYTYLQRNKDIHKLATAHMKVLRKDWTPELAIQTARHFDTISELERNRNDCYDYLKRNKDIHKLATAHMTKAKFMTESVNGVYIIKIKIKDKVTNKFVYYVGQTYVFRNRFYGHLHGNSPVFTYLSAHNCHKPEFYILAENLPLEEALELEKNTIEELYLRGLNLLNVSILGTIKAKHPELPTVQKNIGLRGLKLKKFNYGVD